MLLINCLSIEIFSEIGTKVLTTRNKEPILEETGTGTEKMWYLPIPKIIIRIPHEWFTLNI